MRSVLLVVAEAAEQVESIGIKGFFDSFNEGMAGSLAEFIDKISVLFSVAVFCVLLVVFLLTFKKRANKLSRNVINTLSKNGKYIRGLFVELNDTKELTRYFSYGHKWKKRIIADYNTLFDDENGRRLKEINKEYDVPLYLCGTSSIDKIHDSINKMIEFISKLRKRECVISEEYKKTAMLFEVYGNHYIEKLKKLQARTEFIRKKYIVLTGSAGNGKTNLLCSLAELLIDTGRICVFINSKDVGKDVNLYMEEKLTWSSSKYFKIYWQVFNILCCLFNKTIYIVIDAINENESKEFVESLPRFVNSMLKYHKIKIIVSCRSEYFDLKYKEILVDKVEEDAFCYDIMSEEYSYVAKERMFENYKNAFHYSGQVSLEVKEKLYQQLLLMRMFFEVHKNSDATVNSLNKYEIFQKYIDVVMGSEKEECNAFLEIVVQQMCNSQQYSSVKLSDIKEESELSGVIKDFVDETILLSRKLILHPNSIIQKHDEEIYFVFDEMRDYCVAKYVLGTMCTENGKPIECKVIEFIDKLVDSKSVSTEGVINYIYWYYKGEGNTDMCKTILYKYMQPHDRAIESYRMYREDGLNSWGLKVILENSNNLSDYEKEYVRFIIEENPGNELATLFAFLVHQEEIHGKHNLGLFLEILFKIHNVNKFTDVLKETVSSWGREGISRAEFVQIDMNLEKKNPEGSKRFRYYLFLFLNFLQWDGKEKVLEYFKKVCNMATIYLELKTKIHFEETGEEDESKVQ